MSNNTTIYLQTPRLCNAHGKNWMSLPPHKRQNVPFSPVCNAQSSILFLLFVRLKNWHKECLHALKSMETKRQQSAAVPTRKENLIFSSQKNWMNRIRCWKKCWENIMLAPMSRSTWLCTMEWSAFKNRSHRLRVQHLYICVYSLWVSCFVLLPACTYTTSPSVRVCVCVCVRSVSSKNDSVLLKMVKNICHFSLSLFIELLC